MWYINVFATQEQQQQQQKSTTKCVRVLGKAVFKWIKPHFLEEHQLCTGIFFCSLEILHVRNIIKNRDKRLNGSVRNLCFKLIFFFFVRLWFCLLNSLDGSICEPVRVCVSGYKWVCVYMCVCLFIHRLRFCSFCTYVIFGCFLIYEF